MKGNSRKIIYFLNYTTKNIILVENLLIEFLTCVELICPDWPNGQFSNLETI